MRCLSALLIASFSSISIAYSQSSLLESVKRNPGEAMEMCKNFKSLNAKGISAGSKQVIQEISFQKNLSQTDAEILSIYVIGLNCPDVY